MPLRIRQVIEKGEDILLDQILGYAMNLNDIFDLIDLNEPNVTKWIIEDIQMVLVQDEKHAYASNKEAVNHIATLNRGATFSSISADIAKYFKDERTLVVSILPATNTLHCGSGQYLMARSLNKTITDGFTALKISRYLRDFNNFGCNVIDDNDIIVLELFSNQYSIGICTIPISEIFMEKEAPEADLLPLANGTLHLLQRLELLQDAPLCYSKFEENLQKANTAQ